MTKEQEAAVSAIAEEGEKTNKKMLSQRFPPQVSVPVARGRKENPGSPQPRSK
jgi:hypothetical protein